LGLRKYIRSENGCAAATFQLFPYTDYQGK
jgi:hypothetical protein